MEIIKVGVRQFRAELSAYLTAKDPVAVKKHGQTIGYFIPVRTTTAAEISAFRKASEALEAALVSRQINEDEVVEEFKTLRSGSKPNLSRAGKKVE